LNDGIVQPMYLQAEGSRSQELLLDHVLSLAASFNELNSQQALTDEFSNICLQGPSKSGKTFFMRQASAMITHLYKNVQCIFHDYASGTVSLLSLLMQMTSVTPDAKHRCPLTSILEQLAMQHKYVMVFADNVHCLFGEYKNEQCILDLKIIGNHNNSFVMISDSQHNCRTKKFQWYFDTRNFNVHLLFPLRSLEQCQECIKAVGKTLSDAKVVELFTLHGGCVGNMLNDDEEFHKLKLEEKVKQFQTLSNKYPDVIDFLQHMSCIDEDMKHAGRPWTQLTFSANSLQIVFSERFYELISEELFCMMSNGHYQLLCPIMLEICKKYYPIP